MVCVKSISLSLSLSLSLSHSHSFSLSPLHGDAVGGKLVQASTASHDLLLFLSFSFLRKVLVNWYLSTSTGDLSTTLPARAKYPTDPYFIFGISYEF